MKHLSMQTINKAAEKSKAIQLHRADLESLLKQTPKEDPLYDDFEKFLRLGSQVSNMEISVSEETASLIHEINALDAQVSEKLNHLNRMAG